MKAITQIILSVALSIFVSKAILSQQYPIFGAFQNNYSYFNPSVTGLENNHFANLQYRKMWTNTMGNPETFVGQYEKDFDSLNLGVGMLFSQEKIGHSNNKSGLLQLRYSLHTGEESILAFGASAGILQRSLDTASFYPSEDPSPFTATSQGKFIINAGIQFKRRNLQLGLSALKINEPRFEKVYFDDIIHYTFNAFYDFKISENFKISPRFMAITDIVALSWTLNLKFEHYNRFWYMAGYRNSKAVIVGAGVQFWNMMYLGYIFEFDDYNEILGSTHEVYLSLRLGK